MRTVKRGHGEAAIGEGWLQRLKQLGRFSSMDLYHRKFSAGFLIVRTYDWLFEWYCGCGLFDEALNLGIYALPQKGLRPENYEKRYAGIDRDPLWRWMDSIESAKLDDEELKRLSVEKGAKTALQRLQDLGLSWEDFIFSLDDARDVFSKLLEPREWELIWTAKAESNAPEPPGAIFLGYEPTWFYGDHFSAVADCMCFPRWHGCDPEGILFKEYFDRLNEHALFAAAEEAQRFLDYYRSFKEAEIGDYHIAKVMAIEPLTPT